MSIKICLHCPPQLNPLAIPVHVFPISNIAFRQNVSQLMHWRVVCNAMRHRSLIFGRVGRDSTQWIRSPNEVASARFGNFSVHGTGTWKTCRKMHALTPNVQKNHAIVKARQPYISLNEYMLWQEGPKSLSPKTGRQFSRRAGELSIGAFRRRKGTTQTTAPKHQITHRGKYNEALGKREKHVKKNKKKKTSTPQNRLRRTWEHSWHNFCCIFRIHTP